MRFLHFGKKQKVPSKINIEQINYEENDDYQTISTCDQFETKPASNDYDNYTFSYSEKELENARKIHRTLSKKGLVAVKLIGSLAFLGTLGFIFQRACKGEGSPLLDKTADALEDVMPSSPVIENVKYSRQSVNDGVSRKSAGQLGKMIGKTAQEVNLLLSEKGYLQGKPGNWQLTELGKEKAVMRYKDNGYGGFAARVWGWPMWEKDIVNEIGDPVAYMDSMNSIRRSAGLPLLK